MHDWRCTCKDCSARYAEQDSERQDEGEPTPEELMERAENIRDGLREDGIVL